MKGKWRKREQKYILKTKWLSVLKKSYTTPSGQHIDDYYSLKRGDYIVIVARTTQKKFVLLSQYRHGIDRNILNFPMGFIDKSESPLHAAARELREETGYTSQHIISLGSFLVSPGLINTTFTVYFADACVKDKTYTHVDDEEFVTLKLITQRSIMKMIHSKRAVDAHIALAFLLTMEWLKNFG